MCVCVCVYVCVCVWLGGSAAQGEIGLPTTTYLLGTALTLGAGLKGKRINGCYSYQPMNVCERVCVDVRASVCNRRELLIN